jgi:hypothetical protein
VATRQKAATKPAENSGQFAVWSLKEGRAHGPAAAFAGYKSRVSRSLAPFLSSFYFSNQVYASEVRGGFDQNP